MLKKIGDAGLISIYRFSVVNSETYKYCFDFINVSEQVGKGGFRFANEEALQKFLSKHPTLTFNPNGMFMLIDIHEDDKNIIFILEYDGYAYSILLSDLKFMALYDQKACDFHKGLV